MQLALVRINEARRNISYNMQYIIDMMKYIDYYGRMKNKINMKMKLARIEKDLSQQLLDRKLECLETEQPELIATANIGCLMHLQSGTELPVKHWIELLINRQE